MGTEDFHHRRVEWVVVAEFQLKVENRVLKERLPATPDVAMPLEDGVLQWLGIDTHQLDVAVLHLLVITHQAFASGHGSSLAFEFSFLL